MTNEDLKDLLPDKLGIRITSEMRAGELAGSLKDEMRRIVERAAAALYEEEE